MFTMSLEKIGVEWFGAGHSEQSAGKHFFAFKLDGLAAKLTLFFVWHLLERVLRQRFSIQRQNPAFAIQNHEVLVGSRGEFVSGLDSLSPAWISQVINRLNTDF